MRHALALLAALCMFGALASDARAFATIEPETGVAANTFEATATTVTTLTMGVVVTCTESTMTGTLTRTDASPGTLGTADTDGAGADVDTRTTVTLQIETITWTGCSGGCTATAVASTLGDPAVTGPPYTATASLGATGGAANTAVLTGSASSTFQVAMKCNNIECRFFGTDTFTATLTGGTPGTITIAAEPLTSIASLFCPGGAIGTWTVKMAINTINGVNNPTVTSLAG